MSDREQKQEVLEIFNSLSRELNHLGNEKNVEDALAEFLRCEHPTLQQNFFKHVVVKAIEIMAEKHDNKYFDLRNEASCEIAKKLLSVTKDAMIPFI